MHTIEDRGEKVYVIPRDIDEVLEMGGVASLPEGTGIRFDCRESDFALLIANTANFASVFAAGAIEAGHPGISHGLMEHNSSIFAETMQRIGRAAVGIGSIATAVDARVAGLHVRDRHKDIFGKNKDGLVVPATDPELWVDGYLPIEWLGMDTAFRLKFAKRRLDRAHLEFLIAYQCQGVSDEFMPRTFDEFWDRMADYCESTERTEAIDRFRDEGISCPPALPKLLWQVPPVRKVVNGVSQASTAHALPGSLAQRYNYGEVPTHYRFAAALFAGACTYAAKYGPRIMRAHPHIIEHRYPPKTFIGRTALKASWYATNKFFGVKK